MAVSTQLLNAHGGKAPMVSSSHPPIDRPDSRSSSTLDRQRDALLLPVIGPFDPIPPHVDAVLTGVARLARHGDREARNRLFLAFQPKLLQIARQIRLWMLPSTWDRNDVDQETFIVFSELVEAWSGDTSFTGYLLGHFGWRLRGSVRHARLSERLPTTQSQSADSIADDSWAAEEMRIALEEIASHLHELDGAILIGRVRDGEGFGALAHRLGVSRKTIYRHWTTLIIALKHSLDENVSQNPEPRSRLVRMHLARTKVPIHQFHRGR
jgi:RNA polymerase sigma factor (sigma-70 family)